MTDSKSAKNNLQRSASNPASTAAFKAAVEANAAKSIANFTKPSLDVLNATIPKYLQDMFKQQETVSRMFRSPKAPSFEVPKPPVSTAGYQWSLPKEQWHQLIVLGNGFDLECGLHSRFIDFAYPRFLKLKSWLNESFKNRNQSLHDYGLTIWDVILYYGPKNYWSDVESAIERWVAERDDDGETPCLRISDRLNGQIFLSSSDTSKAEKSVMRFLSALPDAPRIWTSSEVANILLSELNKLEKAFSDYLRNEVDRNESYGQEARNLVNRMLVTELPDEDYYDVSDSLLDFNYTDPSIDADKSSEPHAGERPFPTLVNIHGSLKKNNIIFGIDGTKHMDEPDALPFTKTYRLLSLDNPDIAKLIQTQSPHGVGGSPTAMIKFYGHSLAQADYAYFQAIFDGVDLYESQTRLIFFYRPWQKDDGTRISDAEARADMSRKVAKLLSAYGATLDNKDHGKNLMHKLLIEGRLSVKTI